MRAVRPSTASASMETPLLMSSVVRMRIAGQWLARRLKRRLLVAIDRCDLLAIEHRYGLEQHPRLVGLLTGLRSRSRTGIGAVIPDRFGPLHRAILQLQPRLEPGDKRRG